MKNFLEEYMLVLVIIAIVSMLLVFIVIAHSSNTTTYSEAKTKIDSGYEVYLDGILTNPELIDIKDYKITGIDDDMGIIKLTYKQRSNYAYTPIIVP